ncbi:hypothetical protein C2S51_020194 [Perilla frutescens var. frutescens]|nr:hypothetical protein C2S51_020194 [Perilla frutescens var. frutescens]
MMENVKRLTYLISGHTLDNGLRCMEDDGGLNELVYVINESSCESDMHIYPMEDNEANMKGSNQGLCVGLTSNEAEIDEGLDLDLGDKEPEIDKGLDLGLGDNETVIDEGLDLGVGDDEAGIDECLDFYLGNTKDEMSRIDETELDSNDEYYDERCESDEESNLGEIYLKIFNQNRSKVRYDVDDNNPHFTLGMTFGNAKKARLVIAKYSIEKYTPLTSRPNEPKRLEQNVKLQVVHFICTSQKMVRMVDWL